MPRTLFASLAFAAALLVTAPPGTAAGTDTAPRRTLRAFASEAELTALLRQWADVARARRDQQRSRAAAPASASPALAAQEASADSVTNVQHAGVDEGGIVKVHGDHLVILRRGRLFTVRIADGDLRPVAAVDAFGPGVDPRGAWYDELLIADDTAVVIGYSYARGGTEIGLFDLSRAGALEHRATYHLRSNDYYSSRNYASRLIGSKLVFYTPLYLDPYAADPLASFPALRRWRPGTTPAEFRRIAPATRIYRADDALEAFAGIALHSVTVCDLARAEIHCESTAVMGPPGRVFYVSPDSVFVWTTAWRRGPWDGVPGSAVFRIPLDGSAPSALRTSGAPIDQFSFHQGDDGFLNVLVRAHGRGEAMWAAESNAGDLALLRVPLASFSDGRNSAPESAYRPLPRPTGHALQSRYIGAYLLYGRGAGWRRPQHSAGTQAYAVRYASGEVFELPLAHSVDRIEALGRHALVAGSDGRSLHLTSVHLARVPAPVDHYTRPDAAQGETRSHGFFYKPEGDHEGLLGLPIISGSEPAARQLRKESAALLFLRNSGLSLSELGTLESRPAAADRSDGCRASCVDWYGNSRPLFVRGRVFALLGYELVEGRMGHDRIVELRRISFAPRVSVGGGTSE